MNLCHRRLARYGAACDAAVYLTPSFSSQILMVDDDPEATYELGLQDASMSATEACTKVEL